MQTASWIVFRYMLEKSHLEKQSNFGPYLSKYDREMLETTPSLQEDPFTRIPSSSQSLRNIHYSWFIPFLTPLSKEDQKRLISIFEPTIGAKLKSHLHLNDPFSPLPKLLEDYLQNTLLSWVKRDCEDFISSPFLPPHPLNQLLGLKKHQLQNIADLLGLYDLAAEMNQIVRREQMKKIDTLLSKREKETLKKILETPSPPIFPKLHLDQWDGDEVALKNILHHRGFNRMSKALFGCHKSLFWHVTHRLDTGRAKIMHRFFSDVKNQSIKDTLINQVIGAITLQSEPS